MSQLLDDIVAGEWAVGAMLPREQDLAESLDASRGVVRETVRALEERGVVAVKHGRGATVQERDHWNVLDRDVLRASVEGRDGRTLVEQLAEARALVQPHIAALAAERRRDEDIQALAGQLEAFSRAPSGRGGRRDGGAALAAELAFNRALARAARNAPLAGMLEPLLSGLAGWGALGVRRPGDAEELRAVLDAVADQDAERAATAIAAHLRASRDAIPARRRRAS
jgi:GntR family transcriptional regulator, galactonate operon transcriptional repressor